jgi:hypothetical protein
MTAPQTDPHLAQRERAARYRDRRRSGRVLVSIEVTRRQQQALLRLGLIDPEWVGDGEAVAWAAARFLDAAESVSALGQALYPTEDDFAVGGT